MHDHGLFEKTIAVGLLALTILATTPVSAEDLSRRDPIGSVTAAGRVQLRGVEISQEGTLFNGDTLQSGEKAYAKVIFVNRQKLEVGEKTDVTLSRDGEAVVIGMRSGSAAFTAVNGSPIQIKAEPYEIVIDHIGGGGLSFVGDDFIAVRAMNAQLMIRNTVTKQSFVLSAGQERLLGLKKPVMVRSLGQIASSLPGPIPSARPPQTPSQTSISTRVLVSLLAIVSAATLAVAIPVARRGKVDEADLKSVQAQNAEQQSRQTALSSQFAALQTQLTGLQSAVNTQRTNISQLQTAVSALQTLQQITANAAALQSAGLEALAALQAATNITPQERARLTTQLQTMISEARAAQASAGGLAGGTIDDILGRIAGIEGQVRNTNNLVTNNREFFATLERLGLIPGGQPPFVPIPDCNIAPGQPRCASPSAP